MSVDISFTLVADGSSDKVLLHHITWLLRDLGWAPNGQWADLSFLKEPPSQDDIAERAKTAVSLYPCDVLLVHRDSEGETRVRRAEEIERSVGRLGLREYRPVFIVPVRMTEAWLLFNETAIRQAAGNPNGRTPIDLPRLNEVERLPDPKTTLHEALRVASEKTGRRLKKFNPNSRVHRVAEVIDDYSPLRQLEAFQMLEAEIRQHIGVCEAV